MKVRGCPYTRCGLDVKQAWREAFAVPIHIQIGQHTELAKQISVRPRTLLLLLLFVMIVLALLLSVLLSSGQPTQHMQYIAQLQYEQGNLTRKFSAAEATLALRDSQIESMQQELLRNSHAMHVMKQRLAMFDDVLAARKVGGWHILHPKAEWQDEQTITYHLVVVKGENYPRWAKGHLSFSIIDAAGKSIALDNKRGKRSLKFDMTTHAFFEGIIPWSQAWQPEMLMISLFDKRGKNNQSIEIPILRRNQSSDIKAGGHQIKLKLSKEPTEFVLPQEKKTP